MAGLTNDFAFSFSAWKTYQACPRAWWLSKVLYWGGWQRGASADVRLAYVLTKMTTLYGLAGTIVHEMAKEYVTAPRRWDGINLGAVFEDRFDRALVVSRRGDWQQDPKRAANIFEHYYGHPDVEAREAAARASGLAAVANLPASPAAERAAHGAVLQTEVLERFVVDGIPVWVQIDLVTRVDGVIWLEDHKTGARRPEHRQQAMLYALFAHDVRRVELERLRVALGYLRDGSEDVVAPWSEGEFDELRTTIRWSANEIRAWLEKPREGQPWLNVGAEADFPGVTDPAVCADCRMFHVCKGTREIDWAAAMRPLEIASVR